MLILLFLISFISVIILGKQYIKFLKRIGLVGKDINKWEKPIVAESGGFLVLFGFLASIFLYVFLKTFFYGNNLNKDLFAALLTIIFITIIGFFDDLSSLEKERLKKEDIKEQKRKGLPQYIKPILTLPAAIPLMALSVGNTTLNLPFLGVVDFGIFYPLLIVPVAIMGASNATNMLAGLNGLEAGLGFVTILFQGIYAYLKGSNLASLIAFSFSGALLGFLYYNKYPSKIFPGDSLNYTIGVVIATIAIVGNMEKFSVSIFILWFIELILKLRSKLKAESFGIPNEKNELKPPYKKIYSLTHLYMKFFKREYQISLALILTQTIICIIMFILNWYGVI